MTDQDLGTHRVPEPMQMPHGHRKIGGALAMLVSGEIVGQDVIKFIWDNAIEIVNWSVGTTLEPMPELIAAKIFGLFAAFAFYQTKERP